jgi:adenylate cyclase
MPTTDLKRKLAAILSADVKGYSRLMGEDEEWTVRTLNTHKGAIRTLVGQHRGRVVDSPGDNLLAEFGSVVDAVQCAVEIQQVLKAKNALLPETRRMEFRIGINLGDVIEEEDRIYGDGVNIAARLEGLAEPGGICISETAYLQIENKLPLQYDFMGEHEVKNIARPVKAYRALLEPEARERVQGVGGRAQGKAVRRKASGARRKPILFGAVAAVVLIGAVAVWQFVISPKPPPVEKADPKKMAFPLPDKPSIAVLPFANLSDDPKQEFFADGMTEEIITTLSKSPHLFVIARNSTFTYKGKPVKINQVAEELGVRHVLEGSVRRSEDKVRITAQLIDALTGRHIWAERFDRELKDIFTLQDDVASRVMSALHAKMPAVHRLGETGRGTRNVEAFLKGMEAADSVFRFTKEGNARGRALYEEVIALDPNYARGYAGLALSRAAEVWLGTSQSPKESLGKAIELGERAVALDEKDAAAHAILAYLFAMTRQYDKAVSQAERALSLDPDSHSVLNNSGLALMFSSRPEEAVPLVEKAMRLNPFAAQSHVVLCGAYRFVGRYEEAFEQARRAVDLDPKNQIAQISLADASVRTGRDAETRAAAAEVLKINPRFSIEEYAKGLPYKDRSQVDGMIETLRRAGLPDKSPVEKADPQKMTLPLPDQPSIALLPFANMTQDPAQEPFCDGLTEEIITALSKTPKLFVIASNTTFTYKGKPVKVQQVAEELGVRYVLEGSVQKSGDRVRVMAQLIDALKGNHVWSERYDRELKDLFSVQDDITKNIITAVHVKLTDGEAARVFAKGTSNLHAYLKVSEAIWHTSQATKEGVLRAEQLAEEAIALDPTYAYAYLALGSVHGVRVWLGMSPSPGESMNRCIELMQKAVALDESSGPAHARLGYWLVMARQYDRAIAEGEKGMALDPNSEYVLQWYAATLTFAGRREEAIPLFREALRLNPKPPNVYYRHFGVALVGTGQYDEAISLMKKAIEREPNDTIAYVVLATSCQLAGREEEARTAAKELLRINPRFSLERFAQTTPHKDPAVTERVIEALRKAGLK